MLMDLGNLRAAASGRRAAPLLGGQAPPLGRRGWENPPAEKRGGGGNKSSGYFLKKHTLEGSLYREVIVLVGPEQRHVAAQLLLCISGSVLQLLARMTWLVQPDRMTQNSPNVLKQQSNLSKLSAPVK